LISGLPADLVPLTPEEKAIQRESRRVKRESKKLDMVTKEFAIDNQLNGFLQTLTKLEEEFKRQATERIEKQMQFDLMEKENQRMQNKINTVEEVLEHTKEKMNKLSSTIDRVLYLCFFLLFCFILFYFILFYFILFYFILYYYYFIFVSILLFIDGISLPVHRP